MTHKRTARQPRSTVFAVMFVASALGSLLLAWGEEPSSQQLISTSSSPGTSSSLAPTPRAAVQRESLQPAMASSRPVLDREIVDRAPVRVIRDNYPTYSAVAVDTNSDEVYLQDENLFGFKVFDRMTNTPPLANFSEPKRVVGGMKTKLEFNCGLYIDPVSGDVYSVNNDTVDTMVIFSRDAEGNVPPKRELETPHRTWGIAVNEQDQELYLTVEDPPEVVVYRKMAEGDEKPIRALKGHNTGLADPHGIALDVKNGWMFVSNHGSGADADGVGRFNGASISVYPIKAQGDSPPLRTIAGDRTRLNWPAAMALNEARGELYVANDGDDSLVVFGVTDSGNVAPRRMVRGPKTGIKNPTGVYLDPKNNEVWLSNMGNHTAVVFAMDADGDIPPLRKIRSAPAGKVAQAIGNPGAVGYDTKREQLLVPN